VEPFIREGASPENQEMMTSIVTGIMDGFKASVQESRKISAESLQRIIDQQALLQSSDALQEHLVDAVLYEDQIKDLFRLRLGITDSSDLHEIDFKDYTEDSESEYEDNDGEIAVVYASGGITTGASRYSPNPIFGGDMLGSDTFAEAMQEIRENDYIKAVVIRIESPGGDARASEAMWREISLTRAVKPVIISMAGVAASGGYFIAAAGDTIVCDPATLTGSIGVFSLQLDVQEFLRDKIGINTELIETDPHADMMVNMDEAERAIIARSVDTTYARFLRIVSEGRKLTIDSVQQLAQGRVWTGEQAQQRGLVDVLGGLDTALSIAASRANVGTTDYSIRIYPRPKNPIEAIMDALGSRAMAFISPASPAEQYLEFIKCVQGQSGLQARMPGMKIR
jgi:protease-4